MNIEAFLKERKIKEQENKRINALILRYKKQFPSITAHWDCSSQSISRNDIGGDIVKLGISIFKCKRDELFEALNCPCLYKGKTLWEDIHCSTKIAKVIENWESKTKLSPVFIVKNESTQRGEVADGKHRLTVADRIGESHIFFMIQNGDLCWFTKLLPSHVLVCNTNPCV